MNGEPASPVVYESLPKHLRAGMRRYIEQHIKTGSFLRACLENNLERALMLQYDGRDSSVSMAELRSIVIFLRYGAPPDAWGSPAKVAAWIAHVTQPV